MGEKLVWVKSVWVNGYDFGYDYMNMTMTMAMATVNYG